MKTIILIVCISASILSFGQVTDIGTINMVTYDMRQLNDFRDEFRMKKVLDPDSAVLSGTPYLNPVYSPGQFVTGDNKTFVDIPLRYNVYSDNFEFERANESLILDPGKYALRVTLNDDLFIYTAYPVPGGTRNGYLEVLVEGNVTLYKRHKIIYEPPKPEAAYQDAQPGRFREVSPDYYLRIGEGELSDIPTEKALLDLFYEHSDEIKSHIKKAKLKFRKEEDLIGIIEFVNK
ncbi:MAG TPA: hypothetical protein VMW76_00295 [Bacteroidales bacterium]|nr:hypothetical protein [Bacteroidales bacterium]